MKRYQIVFSLSILLFLGSLVTTFDAIQDRDFQLRGYADASLDADLPFRVPRLGVNAQLFQYDQKQLEQNFELMEQAHVTWVRQFIRWSDIEAKQNQFHWEATDQIFKAFQFHPNLQPVIVLLSAPTWARSNNSETTAPPIDNSDFARFAEKFANRYGEWVDYYQVWDEPNLTTAWGGQEPRAVEYTAMLAEVYKHIHAVDANATVIAAALAPTTETGPKNISDLLFLRDMYTAGAKDYMDAAAAKPYGFDTPPTDRTVSSDTLNFSRIIALREEMVRNGDAKKPLWASEWGWNSLPEAWQGDPSIWGSVSSQEQTYYTVGAVERADREWPWLGGLILNQWQPAAPANDPIWGFALVDQNSQTSPLFNALESYSPPLSARNGLFTAVNPFTSYSGVWTFGPLGADIGWVQDSQFQFQFHASDVSLLLRQDDYTAYLYPQIDGQPANAVPADASGNSYIVLTSPSQKPETNLIPVAKNLPSQPHTLHVVADRGWDRWAIVGFGVSSGSLSLPFDQRIAVGWFTVLLSALSVIIAARQPARQLIRSIFGFIGIYLNATAQFVLSIISSIALLIGMLLTWGDGVTNILRHEPVPLILAIATTGLMKLQPGIIITAVAAIVLFIIFYNQIFIGLALTVFWSPFFLFPVELYRLFPLAEVMLILTTSAWLLRLSVEYARSRQAYNSRFHGGTLRSIVGSLTLVDYLLLVWVILGTVSLLWVKRLPEAVTELRTIFIEPFLFYVVLRTSRPTKKQFLFIVDALLIAGLLVAVIGLWQYVNGDAIITAEGGSRRLASVYGSPNNVALILGRCIPFALAFGLINVDWRRRLFYLCALLPMGIALLLTQSVGGLFIGVPISVAFVCIVTLRRRARFILIGIFVIVIIGFFVSLQSQRFSRMLDFSSGTNFYRVRAWLSAINIIQDHPITGLGLDQFLYEFRGRYILPDAWQEPNLSHPHNIVLDFWVRLGISGVITLIALQAVFWKRMLLLYHSLRQHDLLACSLVVGAIGSMINLIAHGMIDNSVFVIDLSYVFVLLLALTHLENVRSIDEPLI